MTILFIGRHALNHHITKLQPAWALTEPKDIDVIATYDDGIKYLKECRCVMVEPMAEGSKLHGVYLDRDNRDRPQHIEIELAWPDSTAEALLRLVQAESITGGRSFGYAPLNALYALKMSHRYRRNSPHFLKTMYDIRMMRFLGAEITDDLKDWYKAREKETYAYSHPKLNTTRANFFADDGIKYVYDHDSIHQAVKVMEKPAFDYFKPDTAEVFCSKAMFFAAPSEVRINAVYEESCVLALERSIVPYPGVLTHDQAFAKALQKVCTSITSGWFREFAWENYSQALDLHTEKSQKGMDYVTLFQQGVINGTVKPFVA